MRPFFGETSRARADLVDDVHRLPLSGCLWQCYVVSGFEFELCRTLLEHAFLPLLLIFHLLARRTRDPSFHLCCSRPTKRTNTCDSPGAPVTGAQFEQGQPFHTSVARSLDTKPPGILPILSQQLSFGMSLCHSKCPAVNYAPPKSNNPTSLTSTRSV